MTDTKPETPTVTLDSLAPYPETEQEATADALIKHLAVQAFAHHVVTDLPAPGAPRELWQAWTTEIGHILNQFAIVDLLMFLKDFHRDVADDAARSVWAAWQDGGVIPELLWDWLQEHKIDPLVVEKLAKESAAKNAEAAR